MSKVSHKLAVEARSEFGNNAARRARKAGNIPAIVYSKGFENKPVFVNADQWKIFAAHAAHMVTLTCGGEEIPCLVREVQYNYLKNYVVHIDFQRVDLNAEITAKVAIRAHGDAKGASRGVLEQELHELEVICRPMDLPDYIIGEVTDLDLGDRLHVKELVLPEGVRTNVDPETVVFRVKVEKEEEIPAAAEETAAAEPEAINETKAAEKAAAAAEKK